ncbi:DinB family protein [Heyndrickxia vini]|uniref:DinB family protein n=1 Tax=Heyndrickxia vini TaxID=1476025 RepID=A0ABX7E6E6_9BACI|nr:DinB family protein [Heyndrickxia vini]QQZ09907.1 DinB family protein [Heyndrickxia vini]
MIDMFYYNWQVRDEWFTWCEELSIDDLIKNRVGGMGSILKTLFHVIDCEQLWVNQMKGRQVVHYDFANMANLDSVKEFSQFTRPITQKFIHSWSKEQDERILEITRKDGVVLTFAYGKIIRHLISHEIHHIGQLSIWSRELGLKPVNSDLIIRDYF